MKKILLIIFLFNTTLASAQLSVSSFNRLGADQTASLLSPKEDQNGEVCSIIKVVTDVRNLAWEAGSLGIVEVVKKEGEYWLYVPYGSKRLTIKHDKFGVLRNYFYPARIAEGAVYQLVLEMKHAKVKLTVVPEPISATVCLDGDTLGVGKQERMVA